MYGIIENIISKEPFIGTDGRKYLRICKEQLHPRQTFLKGEISGNYRGIKLFDESEKSRVFDIEIYEAIVTCADETCFRKNVPFEYPVDFPGAVAEKSQPFPKEKLPTTLPVTLEAKGKSFGVNILEPRLYQYKIDRKHHQIDGDEVYGSFKALISGYILDHERVELEENIPIHEEDVFIEKEIPCVASYIKTGEFQTKGIYTQYEYYCKNHHDCTVWGPYTNTLKQPTVSETGCAQNIIGLTAGSLFVIFLLSVFPGFGYLLAILIGITLITWLGPWLKWIFRAIAFVFAIAFFLGLYESAKTSSVRNYRAPRSTETRHETTTTSESETIIEHLRNNDNSNLVDVNEKEVDTVIKHFRSWRDYRGNNYSGYYEISGNDFREAARFKNDVPIDAGSRQTYDRLLHTIEGHDAKRFPDLYRMFDSISNSKSLNRTQFAEMVVSFVQDIRYSLILNNGCDPTLYSDRFTREFLLSNEGECVGYQRYGLNTPVEFLATLKGDCDTRTLLLYCILSHYGYDVVLLSSETYGHSILGINLPYSGFSFPYRHKKYVLWETTVPNLKPGQISPEISNMNNWRISLKSTP